MAETIYKKLSKIQKRLLVPKGNFNSFGKYNYRSCEDILVAVKPLLEEENLLLFLNSEVKEIGGRCYTVASAILHDLEGDAEISITASARDEEEKKGMDGSQISGASLSYARKYALAGLFCIDNEKDSDATNDGKKEKKPDPKAETKSDFNENPNQVKVEAVHLATMQKEFDRTGITPEIICNMYKVKTLEDLTMSHFNEIMKRFGNTPNKKG